MSIVRGGATVFSGQVSAASLTRSYEDLIDWLARDNVFPHGVFLMTGTGIVPDDKFTLQPGDVVEITISGIGTLRNPVIQG